jgi:hypothetical protein
VPNRARPETATHQLIAPSDHVRPSDDPKVLKTSNTEEAHEIRERVLIGPQGCRGARIGKLFGRGGNIGES